MLASYVAIVRTKKRIADQSSLSAGCRLSEVNTDSRIPDLLYRARGRCCWIRLVLLGRSTRLGMIASNNWKMSEAAAARRYDRLIRLSTVGAHPSQKAGSNGERGRENINGS